MMFSRFHNKMICRQVEYMVLFYCMLNALPWISLGVFDFFIDNTKMEKLRIAPITYIYN